MPSNFNPSRSLTCIYLYRLLATITCYFLLSQSLPDVLKQHVSYIAGVDC